MAIRGFAGSFLHEDKEEKKKNLNHLPELVTFRRNQIRQIRSIHLIQDRMNFYLASP